MSQKANDIEYEYSQKDNKYFAVLRRATEESKLTKCPFCKQLHTHGKCDGHRIAHCTNRDKYSSPIVIHLDSPNGRIMLNQRDGYLIRTGNAGKRVFRQNMNDTLVAALEAELAALKQQLALDAPIVAAAEAYKLSKNASYVLRMLCRKEPEFNDTLRLLLCAEYNAYDALSDAVDDRREAMAAERSE